MLNGGCTAKRTLKSNISDNKIDVLAANSVFVEISIYLCFMLMISINMLLPSASEGWRQGNIHRCLSIRRVSHVHPIISPSSNTTTGPMSFPGVTKFPHRVPPIYNWIRYLQPGLGEIPPPPPTSQDRDGVPPPFGTT